MFFNLVFIYFVLHNIQCVKIIQIDVLIQLLWPFAHSCLPLYSTPPSSHTRLKFSITPFIILIAIYSTRFQPPHICCYFYRTHSEPTSAPIRKCLTFRIVFALDSSLAVNYFRYLLYSYRPKRCVCGMIFWMNSNVIEIMKLYDPI